MAIKYNIAIDGDTAERHIFAQALREVAKYRGHLLNIQDGQEYDISLLTDVDLVCEKFPLFGRYSSSRKININSGHTCKLGMRELEDGRFCYIQKEDYILSVLTGEDESGEPTYTNYPVEYSKLVIGYSWDDQTEIEPIWKVIDDEQ